MATAVVAPAISSGKPKKLLDQIRDVLRVKHYSLRTERSYCDWVKRFIRFHNLRHPKQMGAADITQFLTHLARIGNVSAATQNQALSSVVVPLSAGAQTRSGLARKGCADGLKIRRLFSPCITFTCCARTVMTGFTLATHRIYEDDCDSTRKEIHSRRRTAVLGS